MKMIWCGLKIKENCHVLVNQFHGNIHSKTLGCRRIKSVFRDVKWCFNASWGLKGLIRVSVCSISGWFQSRHPTGPTDRKNILISWPSLTQYSTVSNSPVWSQTTVSVAHTRHELCIYLPTPKGVIFSLVFVCMFVCLLVCQQDYLQSNERISTNLVPEVCLGLRNNPLYFRGDPDYDPDQGSGLRSGSRCGGVRRSLTDCFVRIITSDYTHRLLIIQFRGTAHTTGVELGVWDPGEYYVKTDFFF